MRDIIYPAHVPTEANPIKRAQSAMARLSLPKRFYTAVSFAPEASGGFAIQLDGKPARTPGKRPLALPTPEAAEVVAREWRAQLEVINPAVMHATRMANTAIDSFTGRMAEIQADAAAYAASDLVCYRAEGPEGLVELQSRHWGPVVEWARQRLGARFVLAAGIVHQAQSPEALGRIADAVRAIDDPVKLAAFHVMTTLTGSCLLALMLAQGEVSADAAWEAATVDDAWSARFWGHDDEAATRLASRQVEFLAADALCQSCG